MLSDCACRFSIILKWILSEYWILPKVQKISVLFWIEVWILYVIKIWIGTDRFQDITKTKFHHFRLIRKDCVALSLCIYLLDINGLKHIFHFILLCYISYLFHCIVRRADLFHLSTARDTWISIFSVVTIYENFRAKMNPACLESDWTRLFIHQACR